MKCDLCEQQARVFLTQIVEGKVKKVNLCQDCSKEKSVTDPTGFAFADMLTGTVSALVHHEVASVPPPPQEHCATCGFTRVDFKRTGRFGCSDCYRILREDLDRLLVNMHKGTRHEGKVPSFLHSRTKPIAAPMAATAGPDLNELKRRLQQSIEEERFEDAARLRDDIRQAEGSMANVS